MKAAAKKVLKPVIMSVAARFGPHRRASAEPRLWVLMYHRVLPRTDERFAQEEPGMLVTPKSFDMHLAELKRHFEIVSLGEWVRRQEAGEQLPARACAVTFDDGWRDNYEYALPILKKHQVPATLFAVAEKIGTDFQFWPNIIAALLLSGAGPSLAGHPVLEPAGSTQAAPDAEEVSRCVQQLKARTEDEIFQALDEINWRTLCKGPMPPALMDWQQLREMQASGLVDIGSHTCTHRRLTGAMAADALRWELVESKNILETQLERPVELFCFPNGDYDQAALNMVHTHYRAAVTTRRGINNSASLKLHELVRIGIHEDISNTPTRLNARLSGWV